MSIKILTGILFFLIVFTLWLIMPYISEQISFKTPSEIIATSTAKQYSASVSISALGQTNPNFLPIRDWTIQEPNIEAKASLILDPEKNKILYQKNIKDILPIASLTKLMTAIITIDNINLQKTIVVSEKAIEAYGRMGNLRVNEEISAENLLYAALLQSSNDAAVALSENIPDFISLMNQRANELKLYDTYFAEPTGLDSQNVSSALDLAKLTKYSLDKPLIWDILKIPAIDIQSTNGKVNHHLVNTNQLLGRKGIIGGKTGYTEEAQECIILLAQTSNESRLIIIILGAEDRFKEAKKLLDWTEKAYIW